MTTDLKPIQDEVLRRVGRNLVIFQQIELFLKTILSHHKYEGPMNGLLEDRRVIAGAVNRSTLGTLVKGYTEEVLKDSESELPDTEDTPIGWGRHTFNVISNPSDREFDPSIQNSLKLVTDERNDLAHHFLPRWQPDSLEKLNDALAYLDAQRDRVLPMHEFLKGNLLQMQESRDMLHQFVSGPEFEKILRSLDDEPPTQA